MWQRPPEGNAMGPVRPYLFCDYARDRQQELLAEVQQASLAKATRADSTTAWLLPTLLMRFVLGLVAKKHYRTHAWIHWERSILR
jgi:hypothetical protein